ncbi:L-2-amino-thiazoline-4-carboxylic acid hydrolase [Synergistaceae bacterium OttesenSCG-928-I11]|nr:L-2-amino-thiazoline-4-carboxylic acid hydrolase [Synergistaceae bacterium OttesenSCG-928-I11]
MNRTDFYIDDHAVLFACLTERAIKAFGNRGRMAVIEGVSIYCRERGLRMAMRCLADGEPLSGKNYVLYGEWADERGWSKSVRVATNPNLRTNMTVCGWCDTWKKYDLLKYGAVYCDWADENLVYGFNPELKLVMGNVMSRSDGPCEFDWVSCTFEDDAEAAAMAARRAELIPRVTKDFLYHTAHVLSAFRRVFLLSFGLVEGRALVDGALARYGELLGDEKIAALEEESRKNFLEV